MAQDEDRKSRNYNQQRNDSSNKQIPYYACNQAHFRMVRVNLVIKFDTKLLGDGKCVMPEAINNAAAFLWYLPLSHAYDVTEWKIQRLELPTLSLKHVACDDTSAGLEGIASCEA